MNIIFYLLVYFFGLIFLWFPSNVLASSITYSSSQTNIGVDDEFIVNAQLTINASNGSIYYLRGEFYQNEGSYCGFTWNGNSWYNGPYNNEGWKNLLLISIQDSSWSGQLKAKIDANDSSCLSSGNYSFRIQRYTPSGSSSNDTQNPISVMVSIPTPSPTPLPTLKPTQQPYLSPSLTPTPTPTPVLSPSAQTPFLSPPATKMAQSKLSSTESANVNIQPTGLVLASESVKTPNSSPFTKQVSKKNFAFLAFFLISVGMILVGISVYTAFKKQKETSS